jgi:hypothetical protein
MNCRPKGRLYENRQGPWFSHKLEDPAIPPMEKSLCRAEETLHLWCRARTKRLS